MNEQIPTHVTVPEGYTVRVIDNYAGDHDAIVAPGRYVLTPRTRTERAFYTRSGKDEVRHLEVVATLEIIEPERVVATVLYAGRALCTKVEPAHTAERTLRIEPWHLSDLGRWFPSLSFDFEAVAA